MPFKQTTEHRSYHGMRDRCYRETNKNFARYGGRGITVCDRWLEHNRGFKNFLEDMGRKPSPEHMIDRVDNDLGYCKENCRWVVMKQQVRNREVTLRDDDGTPIAEIAEQAGLRYATVYSRYRQGARGADLIGGRNV